VVSFSNARCQLNMPGQAEPVPPIGIAGASMCSHFFFFFLQSAGHVFFVSPLLFSHFPSPQEEPPPQSISHDLAVSGGVQ
jgi:hypothetical protein